MKLLVVGQTMQEITQRAIRVAPKPSNVCAQAQHLTHSFCQTTPRAQVLVLCQKCFDVLRARDSQKSLTSQDPRVNWMAVSLAATKEDSPLPVVSWPLACCTVAH